MLTSWSIPVAVTPVTEDEIDESRSDTTAGDREIELKGDQFEEMTDSKLKLNYFCVISCFSWVRTTKQLLHQIFLRYSRSCHQS